MERVLVISAHALDYLWRCGGTLAKYAEQGAEVKVLDLTCGERGESNALWNANSDASEESIAVIRREEAQKAAEILGAQIEFMGWKDHMIAYSEDHLISLTKKIKEFQPTIVLTHFTADPMNPDHPITADIALKAFRCAQSSGVIPELKACKGMKLYMFEPAYPETVGYVPDVYIDITSTMSKKMEAMLSGSAQRVLAEAYDKRNGYRGHLASKLSGNGNIKYAETFLRFKPYVGDWFC